MKAAIAICIIIVTMVAAAPNRHAETLRYVSNVEPENYQFDVETSDGKAFKEEGVLKHPGTDDAALSVRGSYHYIGDDGNTYQVNYIADENGFQAQGTHLPVA